MKNESVILKQGKEKAIKNRHHWIFSGAVQSMPDFENGSVLGVISHDGEFLGRAYFNKKTSIIGRMLVFDKSPEKEAIKKNIIDAVNMRCAFFNEDTNAYRLINGEGDGLPGLIVDRYNHVLVIQISTLGMEKLKPYILEILIDELSPKLIYEKSKLPSRKEEGMTNFEGCLHGEVMDPVEIKENGMRFKVNLVKSQKTGFYLDQRGMRMLTRKFAKGKKILNCFSYTGAFTAYALRGGAIRVDSVDESEEAIHLARENVKLNGYDVRNNKFYVADVFSFIRAIHDEYDFIILDPPAFAKKKSDVIKACRGYKDINRVAMGKVSKGGLIMTCSCSYYVDEALFQKVIFQAASEAGKNVRIIQQHHLALDHPVNIFHPESQYLKAFLLYLS